MKTRSIAFIGVCWSLTVAACAHAATQPPGLGTSAATDPQDRLWVAYAEADRGGSVVKISRFDAASDRWVDIRTVNKAPEAISADGENRPKLAFGMADEIYVSWTSPTSDRYTGDIRFARSLNGGGSWSAPITVHRDRQRITHRFESMIVDREGRIWVAWIDKRDLHAAEARRTEYAGAAIYYTYSEDRGETWKGDFKLADHSCECCRIALTLDPQGRPAAMWRHVYAPNERDHALATLEPGSRPPRFARVTFDRWRIDACPHHGPGLAVSASGVNHAVWFNHVEGQGTAFYGQLQHPAAPARVRRLPVGASHAEIVSRGRRVAATWKRFDGARTQVESMISEDDGETFSAGPTLHSAFASDQPRLVATDAAMLLVWRRAEGIAVVEIGPSSSQAAGDAPSSRLAGAVAPIAGLRPFGPDSMRAIERAYKGRSFWLVLWDLECTYCMKSLAYFAEAQERYPSLNIVTVTTDSLAQERQVVERLAELGVRSEAYAFDGAQVEALRYAIDPAWSGEKPRAYRYRATGERTASSGVLGIEDIIPLKGGD